MKKKNAKTIKNVGAQQDTVKESQDSLGISWRRHPYIGQKLAGNWADFFFTWKYQPSSPRADTACCEVLKHLAWPELL